MKDKIEVEEYIRTYDGIIGKILEDEDIGENGVCIDTTFLDDYAEEKNFAKYEDIKEHSFNIEDLLEKGDYVNGHRIDEIKNGYIYCEECEGIYNYITDKINHNDKIVTKEQFKNIEYEV